MRVLTLYALAVAISIPGGTIFKAMGRAGILLAVGVPEAILLFAAIWTFVDHGIVAVAACMAGVMGATALINTGLAMAKLGVGMRAVWRLLWPPLLATAGMAAVLFPIERAIDSPWPALVIGGVAGGLTYLGLLWLFARDALIRLRDIARGQGGGRGDEGAPGTDAVA